MFLQKCPTLIITIKTNVSLSNVAIINTIPIAVNVNFDFIFWLLGTLALHM